MGKELNVDVSNEQVVIRAAMADAAKRRVLVHSIGDSEFLAKQHATCWRAMRQLCDRKLEYSPDALRQLIVAEGGTPDDDYLLELHNAAEVVPNLDWHISTMRWDATRARVLEETVPALIADLQTATVAQDEAVGKARAIVKALGGGGRRHIHRPEELARSWKAELQERRLKGNFWSSGWPALDGKLTEGLMPRRTTVLTGLPGSGKSTFVCKLALLLANLKRRVLMCTWEMPSRSTLDVLACALLDIDMRRLMQGELTDEELKRCGQAADWITRRIRFMENAFFDQIQQQKGKPNNDRNLDILEGYVAESGCDVLIMDLWERCLVDLSPEGVTRALYRQQAMHAEYACHGILVQQLRLKDVERRADKRPTRESIKGTGAYVEVADLIFGIHRDAQFKSVPDDAMEAICLKQRKGVANFAVRFGWRPDSCQISGGVEVPYDPGLESVGEFGEVKDVSAIQARPARRGKPMGRRDA